MTSHPAARHHPNPGYDSPVPVPAVDPYTVETLREAQTLLDQVPSCDAKGLLRLKLDGLQRWHGGAGEWGRRADGSRPSEDRRAA